MKRLARGERREIIDWQKYSPLKKIIDTNTTKGWNVEKVTLVFDEWVIDRVTNNFVEVIFIKENRDHVKATFSGNYVIKQLHKFAQDEVDNEESSTTQV